MSNYLIFDFDGTIANTYPFMFDLFNKTESRFKRDEFKFEDIHSKGLLTLKDELSKKDKAISAYLLWRSKRIFKKETASLDLSFIPVFEGLSVVLEKLSKNNFLGILTSNNEDFVNGFLNAHGLSDYFGFIKCDSSFFGKHKNLNNVCDEFNLPKNRVFYVGDEDRDVLAAKKARVGSVAVSWGFNSENVLKKYKPDYLLNSPDELLKFLADKI